MNIRNYMAKSRYTYAFCGRIDKEMDYLDTDLISWSFFKFGIRKWFCMGNKSTCRAEWKELYD